MSKEEQLITEMDGLYKLFLQEESDNPAQFFSYPELTHTQSERLINHYVIASFVIIAVFLALYFGDFVSGEIVKLVMLLLMLLGYMGIAVVLLLEIYSDRRDILKIFKNPLSLAFEGLLTASKSDVKLMGAIQDYSTEVLGLVKSRLEIQKTGIERRMGILVGAVEKMGVLPGLLTLYLAYKESESQVLFCLAIFVFILYLCALSVHYALPRLEVYSRLINLELGRRERITE